MRQILLFLICFAIFGFFACSQKYGINKTYAYTRTITAGNISVDDQNRPQTKGVQRNYVLYIETEATGQPLWDTAWINGEAFTIQPLKITTDSIVIGRTAKSLETVSLKPRSGYSLWQLLLTPSLSSTQHNDPQEKRAKTEILLLGGWKGKRVKFREKNIIELERIFME